jgi:hypothetical protein
MNQTQQVIEVMKKLGGLATFGKLNSAVDFSNWETSSLEASVRRIVQKSPAFFRIKPGLWGLEEQREEILKKFNIKLDGKDAPNEFSHSYYQGLAVEIGNFREMKTFIPNQDKNKLFVDKPLKNVATLPEIYQFTYDRLIERARTIDVTWFNKRKMPNAFFEIEHSTDFKNSLLKFSELQDFNAKFYIVADEHRQKQFDKIISGYSTFESIIARVKFLSYESLADMHSQTYKLARAGLL